LFALTLFVSAAAMMLGATLLLVSGLLKRAQLPPIEPLPQVNAA
jgi:hypothetical protein